MPQKLNKAGNMQDYVAEGNGDESGDYRGGQKLNASVGDLFYDLIGKLLKMNSFCS